MSETSVRVSPIVSSLRVKLCVDLYRHDVALIRVSARDGEKLSSQENTGIEVYSDNPDFAALAAMDKSFGKRGWHELRYSDIHARGGQRRLGWVGLVGRTWFLAVPDSAAELNLPPDPDDPAQIGRNAFATALVALAIAVRAENVWVPFLSRLWRDNFNGVTILKSIWTALPDCKIWDGRELLQPDGNGQTVTMVKGGGASTYVLDLKAQTFSGVVKILDNGGWARTERELPAGLRRVRKLGEGKAREVEFDQQWWPIVQQAFEMLAAGEGYDAIGAFLAAKDFPMRGTHGVGLTWKQYSHTAARKEGTRRLLTDPDALAYYRTGKMPVRINTAAALGADGRIRGVVPEYDPILRKHFWSDELVLPHQPVLTEEQWAQVDARLAREEEDRERVRGAASHDRDEGAAFQGVTAWRVSDGREAKLAPETSTAYRWRERERETRGWNNNEGDLVATLRKANFDRACGAAIIEALKGLGNPLAVHTTTVDRDPLEPMRVRVAELTTELSRLVKAARRAEEELLSADDADDQTTWREVRKAKRAEAAVVEGQLEAARHALEDAAVDAVVEVESQSADVALPALVASLLLDSDGTVSHSTTAGLRKLGVPSTLHLRFENPAELPAYQRPDSERNDCRIERWVIASATMTVELANGERVEVPLEWRILDSWAQPGSANLTAQVIRQWADGHSPEEIERLTPGVAASHVRRRLVDRMHEAGMTGRYAPSIAVNCPVTATRKVIAARLLDDRSLVSGIRPDLVQHIEHAYFDGDSTFTLWCDTPGLDEVRRVLAVFAAADRSVNLTGLPTDSLGRLAGVPQREIRRIGRSRGVVELPDHGTVRPRTCEHCKVPMTTYTPCPETAPTGLVCPQCTRTAGSDVALGVEYLTNWQRTDDGYVVAAAPVVQRPSAERDVTLSVSEVASRLAVPAHTVREWDKLGKLVPHRRDAHGNRIYLPAQLKAGQALAAAWLVKNGASLTTPDLLTGPEAAAILGVTPKQLRSWAQMSPPLITAAEVHPKGALYRRHDVEALVPRVAEFVEASNYATIGDVAEETGHATSTIRDLTNQGVLSCLMFGTRRRYDRVAVRETLAALDLLGEPDNPIISIGQLEERTGVDQAVLRRLSNEGMIPTAGRLGGKRRYRAQDAVRAVDSYLASKTQELSRT